MFNDPVATGTLVGGPIGDRVGLVGGPFFALSFATGGLGAARLSEVADQTSIGFVYRLCAFLPAIGLPAAFLPRIRPGV